MPYFDGLCGSKMPKYINGCKIDLITPCVLKCDIDPDDSDWWKCELCSDGWYDRYGDDDLINVVELKSDEKLCCNLCKSYRTKISIMKWDQNLCTDGCDVDSDDDDDNKKLCNWCNEMLTPDYFETPKPDGCNPDNNYCDGCIENEQCANDIHYLLDEILKLRNENEKLKNFKQNDE
tara:strand:+ start:65 stop:595 length:531 start_codon:yes stop_codon:yes gene_type:complete